MRNPAFKLQCPLQRTSHSQLGSEGYRTWCHIIPRSASQPGSYWSSQCLPWMSWVPVIIFSNHHSWVGCVGTVMWYLVLVNDVLRALTKYMWDKGKVGLSRKYPVMEVISLIPNRWKDLSLHSHSTCRGHCVPSGGVYLNVQYIIFCPYSPVWNNHCSCDHHSFYPHHWFGVLFSGIHVLHHHLNDLCLYLETCGEISQHNHFTTFIAMTFHRISLLLTFVNVMGLILLSCF